MLMCCDDCHALIETVSSAPHNCDEEARPVEIQCDVCDARELLGGEVNEQTLEDEGWYLGDISILCPEHSEEFLHSGR